ncbi:MAG: transposase, partial [Bacteroidota bacterium]
VRSSKSHFVKCSGLRWIVVMVLCPVSWANRIWALPFLTVLSPSKRYYEQRGKRHKKLSDWTRQICLLLSRWLPDFQLIMVGDAAYSIIDLLDATRNHVHWITRIRIDAALFDFASAYQGRGRPRITGKKLPTMQQRLNHPDTQWQQVRFSKWYKEKNKIMEITSGKALWYRTGKPHIPLKWVIIRDPNGLLDPVAIQCTDLNLSAIQIVKHYLKRWQVEVTFEELRTHLGVETQRQWADLSIQRTTPTLMALFSLVTLWADQLNSMKKLTVFQTTWYHKDYPTFSDAMASVRYRIWQYQIYLRSAKLTDRNKKRGSLIDHLAFMVARAI